MVKEGYPFVIVALLIAVLFGFFHLWILATVFGLVTLFMAYFFRDPERVIPDEPGIIVSPADGRVTRVEENGHGKFISIFLSPLDVHINRAPIGGKIEKVIYTPGKKIPATRDEASTINERNSLEIAASDISVTCTQIAGIVARRIVCWKKEGEVVGRGERFGLIKFSSRTDLQMPSNVEVMVKVDDRVKGGETIVARIK
jgi:phosphatidylserine decarboxylase